MSNGEKHPGVRQSTHLLLNRCRLFGTMGGLLSFLLAVFLNMPQAQEQGSILIINSDMAVNRYLVAQIEFKSQLNVPQVVIDLGKKWADVSRVEDTILDKDPEVIYCIGSKAYLMAYRLAKDKNPIFSSTINWQRFPLTENTYGISNELPSGMQLLMYRYFFPGISKIGLLYSKKYNKEWLKTSVEDAEQVGIEVIGRAIGKPDQVESALEELLPRVDALWLISDPIVISSEKSVEQIFRQSDGMKKPVFAYNEAFAGYGAVMIISADIPTIGRQAAQLALRILAEQEITEKVQNPAGSHIIANMKKTEEYGIELNVEALDSVNRIIK